MRDQQFCGSMHLRRIKGVILCLAERPCPRHLPFDCTRDSDWKARCFRRVSESVLGGLACGEAEVVLQAEEETHETCHETCHERRNFATACTSEQKYDCDAGVWNWQAAWSSNKKAFCCQHFQRGCSATRKTSTKEILSNIKLT